MVHIMSEPFTIKMHYRNQYYNKYYFDNRKKKNRKRMAVKIAKVTLTVFILIVLAFTLIPIVQSFVSGHSAIIGLNYYSLRDPTYNEMLSFIRSDRTNEHIYSFPDYVCADFSRDTQYNAIRAGYRCGKVNLRFEGGQSVMIGNTIYENGHTVICFETSDKGLVFIEPQHDDIVKIETGCSFSQLNNYVKAPNDFIESYSISWIVADIIP